MEGNEAFEDMTGLADPYGNGSARSRRGLEQHWFDLYGGWRATDSRCGSRIRPTSSADGTTCRRCGSGSRGAYQVAILFNNITERKQSEARQAALLELNDAIRDLTDAGEIALASARVLAQAMGVSRAGYGTVDTVAETITIERDFNQPGVGSIAGTLAFREHGSYIEDISAARRWPSPMSRWTPARPRRRRC